MNLNIDIKYLSRLYNCVPFWWKWRMLKNMTNEQLFGLKEEKLPRWYRKVIYKKALPFLRGEYGLEDL